MTDPTRFDLDDRQRAMLAEMGVRVWWPQRDGDAAAKQPIAAAAAAAQGTHTDQPPTVRAPLSEGLPPTSTRRSPAAPTDLPARTPMPGHVASMGWHELQACAAACSACALCEQRTLPVWGMGDAQAHWMVIGDPPSEDDDAAGQPFAGDEGLLLDNMLHAVGVSRAGHGAAGAYVTSVSKCRTSDKRPATASELLTCLPYVHRQIVLVQPKVILLMGRFAAQGLLHTQEPLGKLRGQVHHHEGVPVVVTYAPRTLLRNSADKAKAWADLVLALQTARRLSSPALPRDQGL